ncbi:MAG: hypothetical protein ACXAEU_13755, partial [Candidatus Hodarchaeales archaeon]
MRFKEMKRKDVLKILESQTDILTPLAEADNKIYKDALCPRCGSESYPLIRTEDLIEVDKKTGEIIGVGHRLANRPIPRKLCKCLRCKCLYDPFSGLILEMGNLG